MKVGDLIRRRDMPSLCYRILGESDEWKGMWSVESEVKLRTGRKPRGMLATGMIDKNDERWEVVEEGRDDE